MPLRILSNFEKTNLSRLTGLSIDVTLIQPTQTGLGKNILDATAPVRNYLRERELHDYDRQGTGAKENGEELEGIFVSATSEVTSRVSLYRPKAKGNGGDPRIWFSGLPAFSKPDDMIAITVQDRTLVCINLTQTDLSNILDRPVQGPLLQRLAAISGISTSVADELLRKLQALAQQGFLKSVMDERADTAIGRTLETALGIAINSRREPDYKGIELKSFRHAPSKSRETRKTLFAKVANWDRSQFKSSREILDAFGYARGDDFKLYCSVSTQVENSQGLSFKIDDRAGLLNECSSQAGIGAFAIWVLQDLRQALAEKHNETFWVGAQAHNVAGHEHFELKSVMHTRKPILSQFDILLDQGEITMDHLIKRNARGRVSEKGPLFKINAASLGLLFPPSTTHTF
jgi:hypothetical protein